MESPHADKTYIELFPKMRLVVEEVENGFFIRSSHANKIWVAIDVKSLKVLIGNLWHGTLKAREKNVFKKTA